MEWCQSTSFQNFQLHCCVDYYQLWWSSRPNPPLRNPHLKAVKLGRVPVSGSEARGAPRGSSARLPSSPVATHFSSFSRSLSSGGRWTERGANRESCRKNLRIRREILTVLNTNNKIAPSSGTRRLSCTTMRGIGLSLFNI